MVNANVAFMDWVRRVFQGVENWPPREKLPPRTRRCAKVLLAPMTPYQKMRVAFDRPPRVQAGIC